MAKQSFTVGQVLTAAQLLDLQQTALGGGSATTKTASYVLVAADAGTTVAMTSTSATTVTVNTGLFAAGDTVFIQNLGSGNLTITAGTATVNTAGSLILPQYDAGILYFVSASSAIFYDYIQVGATSPLTTKGDLYTFSTSDTRLGVGANGTTLVADSAQATGLKWASAAGGLNLIQRSTFTGVADTSTTFDGVISATYKSYLIRFETLASSTQADDLQFQLRYSGTTDTDYYAGLWQIPYNSTTITNTGGANVAVVTLATNSRTSPFFPFSGDLNLSNIGTTLRANIYGLGHESNNVQVSIISGQSSEARTFTGFILKSASANISGTVAVYGYGI